MRTIIFSITSIIVMVCLCSGCLATSADLQQIAAKQAEGEARIAAKMAEFEAGRATWDEVAQEIKHAWGETGMEIGEVAETVKERAEGALQMTWESILGAILATSGVAGVGLNMYRNRNMPGTVRKAPPRVT